MRGNIYETCGPRDYKHSTFTNNDEIIREHHDALNEHANLSVAIDKKHNILASDDGRVVMNTRTVV
ncbi:hypothetical protein KFK09_011231 [Dendrobium nobile]|uniref:Uncharacterized protein n=1 Tax=Dendrobium nobile TaxID=94219 RepID=A0A8T3BE04_DENNO|nr:hypothetical protein KFK09_011231 [Dendrobium nobile]